MVIRLAEAEDVPAIVKLVNVAYEVEKFFVEGDRTSIEVVRALMRKGLFLVGVTEDGRVVACVYLERRGARAYFGMLAVDPVAQGQGWGRRMVEAAEQRALQDGCVAMDIRVVNLRTELPPFYARLGYASLGTEAAEDPRATQPFYFIRMSKPLAS
jgi:N-acetylglutamate synthase-like GNAT family acetyltransferase